MTPGTRSIGYYKNFNNLHNRETLERKAIALLEKMRKHSSGLFATPAGCIFAMCVSEYTIWRKVLRLVST